MSEFNHPNMTPWGYTIDSESLPDLLTTTEFANFTGGKFTPSDPRVTPNIKSASSSIRNFCGWHISPALTCGMIYRVVDLRDAFIGHDLLIQLPSTFVSSVEKIVINAKMNPGAGYYEGDEIGADDFDLEGSGMVRLYDVDYIDRKSKIFIKFVSGLSDSQIGAIKEIMANSVTKGLTNTYGVSNEAAGGVSITYNTSWSGKGSTALANDTREVLDPYKVKGVF